MNRFVFSDSEGENILNGFVEFLNSYQVERNDTVDNASSTAFEYVDQLQSMQAFGKTTLFVDFTHVLSYDGSLASLILSEYHRFEPYLRKGVERFVQSHLGNYVQEEGVPKEFYISFFNLPVINKLRELRAEVVGQLVAVSGVVTRTSEVRPELLYGNFICLLCASVTKGVEQQFKYTEPLVCVNASCSNREKWNLVRHDSVFVDWQRLRMQEASDEIPPGSLPRSLDVILRHEIVEQARAGDKCIFTGTLVVIPDVGALSRAGESQESMRSREGMQNGGMAEGMRGLKALGVRNLNYRLAFLACSVQSADRDRQLVNLQAEEEEGAAIDPFSEEEKEEIRKMSETTGLYEKLVNSLAPFIYGHSDIKRAIALMLFGGVHKKTHEGINLRGDINVCIVGDPSCAKSQFLKYVAAFQPRAVYTSGKASSAAGLTASVVKEPETGEFCIEAGALMLADNGICCIDEFDKMDIKDQVAIHEAMEQQTISISKAGIQATLNARTSILAAANPAAGRYDRSKPLKYNVALPPAILSRFDLVHVMVDEPDELKDYRIARHIIKVHQQRDTAVTPTFTTLQLQNYIKYARTIKPQLTDEARQRLVESYVSLRRGDANPGSNTSYRITVRQLEALIRLSEALARLHCDSHITPAHVREAKRLLSTSIINIETHDIDLDIDVDEDADVAMNMNGFGKKEPQTPQDEELLKKENVTSPFTPSMYETETEMENQNENENNEEDSLRIKNSQMMEIDDVDSKKEKKEKGEKLRVQVTYERFQQITQALVMHLRQKEEESLSSGQGGIAGMRQVELVRWYVEIKNSQGSFDSIHDVVREYRVVRSVIEHLINREGVLVVLDEGTAAVEEAQKKREEEDAQALSQGSEKSTKPLPSPVDERVLAVSSNYVLD